MSFPNRITIIGMMGAGKTALGEVLAPEIGYQFIDTDQEIERAASMRISEIFERDGEAFFRKKEAQIVARLVKKDKLVLSTGGGTFMMPETQDVLLSGSFVVWLNSSLETLWKRVKRNSARPLLRVSDPKAKLASLLKERESAYQKAHCHVTSELGDDLHKIASRVLEKARHFDHAYQEGADTNGS